MGNRLSTITTRTGDNGTTGLGDGSRVGKDALRIHALGEVDELNAHIGLLLCEVLPADVSPILNRIQHDLFDLGGELCIPGLALLKDAQVNQLEQWIEFYNDTLPRLEEFVLPGGSKAGAQAHVCRTVCRRAERTMVSLGKEEALRDAPRLYVNRLSDLMFILARILNRSAGKHDVLWVHNTRTAR
ncbi:MAG: cob(I)yrinic acid a,c-diamide adenosyltransferase [Ottowia sp.]|nr:cob(I)yrinic acid a,c-diamide adenosyltransferase [Ottowia sp.]